MSSEKRKLITLEILPLLLTVIIAVSACLSTYYSYQTAKITSGQESREKRKEFIQWITLLKEIAESVDKLEQEVELGEVGTSNELTNPTAEKPPGP